MDLKVPHEHIVVSDGPFPNERGWNIRYQLRGRTGGPATAIMVANYMAVGDWRIILPDDDYLVPGGLEDLYQEAINGGFDFVYGQQGLTSPGEQGTVRRWNGAYPIQPGESGAFLFRKELLAIAHLERGSAFPGVKTEAGNDWPLLQKWVAAGAKYAYFPIHVMVHSEDGYPE